MPDKRIAITGGSGLVGKRLTQLLQQKGYQVAWVSRSPQQQTNVKTFIWNIEKGTIDPDLFEWADGIVHLAGAGIADEKWTEKRKQILYDSRVKSSELLFHELEKASRRPVTIVSASAIGYYGFETTATPLDEHAPSGNGFLAELTADWEKSTAKFSQLGIRTSLVRIGVVLAKEGGAIPEMTKLPVIQPLGHGKQFMAWIHIDDLCKQFLFLLENKELSGIFNGTAPAMDTNNTLSKKLAKASKRIYLPIGVPKFMLKLIVGELSDMLLESSAVTPLNFIQSGFKFDYATLDNALTDIFTPK